MLSELIIHYKRTPEVNNLYFKQKEISSLAIALRSIIIFYPQINLPQNFILLYLFL